MSDQNDTPVDPRSEKAIATLHERMKPKARDLVRRAAAEGIEIRITSGTRTYDEQDELYAQGRTKPGKIVTKARAGQSNHNFGIAIDVTIFKDGQPVWESPRYKRVGEIGEAIGFEWGGRWATIKDEPHFELRPAWARDLSESAMLNELRKRTANKQDVFGTDQATVSTQFMKTLQPVANRGKAPEAFLTELIQWGRSAPEDIFASRPDPAPPEHDIYTWIKPILGPWEGARHRKAVMLEVLRVLAGFESSWNWREGRDVQNPTENTAVTISAGAFQVSANSMNFDRSLKELVRSRAGTTDGTAFQAAMKSDHALALEYTARLIRFTHRHHGPILRKEIHSWLRRDSVAEFQRFLG